METIKLFADKSQLLAMFDPKDQGRAHWQGSGWYYMLPDYIWHGPYLTEEMARAWQDRELEPSNGVSLGLRIHHCKHKLVEEIQRIIVGFERSIYGIDSVLVKIELAQSVLRDQIKKLILEFRGLPDWQIEKLLENGLVIEAIKTYRNIYGGELIEVKKKVDEIRTRLGLI